VNTATTGELEARLQEALERHAAGDLPAAELLYTAVLHVDPGHFDALHMLGVVRAQRGDPSGAITLLMRAVEMDAAFPEAWHNLGSALNAAGAFTQALTAFDRALALRPAYADALNGVAYARLELGERDRAVLAASAAVTADPDCADAWNTRAVAREREREFVTALLDYRRATAAAQRRRRGDVEAVAFSGEVMAAAQLCEWDGWARRVDLLAELVDAGRPVEPFATLAMLDRPDLQRRAAETRAARFDPAPTPLAPPSRDGGRLRIAYVSPDVRDHPVGLQVAELVEAHDRSRVWAAVVATSASDASAARARVVAAADAFVEAHGRSDADVARALARLDLDVLVDLAGHTTGARPALLAMRPARHAVSFLGYPGTTGAPWIDAVVADPWCVPHGDERHYSEAVLRLDGSALARDSRTVRAAPPERAAFGLPAHGFVFCSFNQAYKLNPTVFDTWLEVLRRVPGSVLWIGHCGVEAVERLRAWARHRDVDPARLVVAPFARRREDYLGRLPLADLVLDTWPYNAHSTASDALGEGVPVLTLSGRTYAGRVAGGLLRTVGLAEFVCADADAFVLRAVEIASGAHDAALRAWRRTAATRLRARDVAMPLERALERVVDRAFASDR
jgi:predicted O-linked N-acetylglucosamine transferase (SPINDLY family)